MTMPVTDVSHDLDARILTSTDVRGIRAASTPFGVSHLAQPTSWKVPAG